MPPLDSKNPFDWIVLNALHLSGYERMSELIQSILGASEDDIDVMYARRGKD